MKTSKYTCLTLLLTASAMLVASPETFAASGTWTQSASGGLWSDTANWSGGTIADGSGFSGIFNTIDITADNTVHMDAAHTLTSLTFGDTDTNSAAGWTVDNNGTAGNILTLAGTTPSITVSPLGAGKTATISAVLAGTTAWSKLGAGTLTLSGANTFTGNWAVNAGVLNYNGSLTGGTLLTVNGSGANSIVNIGPGASIAFNNANILVGNNATAGTAGAVFQSAGTVTGVNQLQLGAVTGGSYGYYNLSGSAALTISELDCGGFNGAPTGVFDVTGGTLTDTSYLILARGSGGSSLLNLTGGTVNFTGTVADRMIMNFNANASQSAVINIANASFNALNATGGILNMMRSGSAGEFSAVNLLSGGVMQVQGVKAPNTTGTSHFNFNGGTLKASTANATFLDVSVSLANVYSGGGTVDNNGVNITIAKALTAPAGNGLNGSVTLNSGGSGYVGAPAVAFSGGGGTGATAYATVSGGVVTGVVITSPGVNYSSTPTIVFTGGGGTGASATAPAPTANTGGGMVFQGSGTTILRGTNAYGGNTTVNSGTTILTAANTYGGNTIINGGTLKLGSALLHLSFDNYSGSTVFNDGSGGAALNGTLNGTATIVSGGMFGNCMQISGANAAAASCRVASSVVPLNVGAGNSWTVAMWVKSSTAGGCYAYQGDGAWGSGNTTFYMNQGNGTLNASSTKAGGVRNGQGWEKGTSDINNGQWHHVVLTCNGTTKTQYVDGNVDSLTVNSWNGNGTGGQFWIGGSADTGDGTANLNGYIDEVYVCGRALSQTEVQSLYNNNSISETILPPSTTVAVAAGATFDVSATAFTVPASLMGSGVVTGAVTASSTSGIFAGTAGAAGTLSFSNNLTMTSGSTFNLDVGTSAASGNDSVIVNGALALNTTTFNVKALGGASDLDTNADYVLVTAGSISGSPNAAVNWIGTAPGNAANFTVVNNGNTVVLRYTEIVQNPPTITSATASPSSLKRGQKALITAAVTAGSNPLGSVTVNALAVGDASSLALISDGAGNYTNIVTVSAGTALGNHTLVVTATDTASLGAVSNVVVSVVVASEVWSGGGSDNKWSSNPNWVSGLAPGPVGDSVTFAGSTQTSPDMDGNYSVTGVTFDSGATGFTIGTAGSTLTLAGSGVTNNSANTQTLNVPVSMSSAQALNAAAGNLTFGQNIANGGNAITVTGSSNTVVNGVISGTGTLTKTGNGSLTLAGGNTYSGATTVAGGTVSVPSGGAIANTDGNFSVGTVAGVNSTLSISGGSVSDSTTTGNAWASYLQVGNGANYSGIVNMNAGALNARRHLVLGNNGGYGAMTMGSGTLTVGSYFIVGFRQTSAGGYGVFNETGGAVTQNQSGSGATLIGSGDGGVGVMNLSGGTFTASAGGIFLPENGSSTGTLNISGTAAVTVGNVGIKFGNNAGTSTGILNLLGGTLTANLLQQGNGTSTVNFNGGTLKASVTNAAFMTGLTAARVFSGGAKIDDGGFAITIGQPLLAPTGDGISSISVDNGGSGYLDTPVVTLSGGGGSGATAVASVSGGVVVGFTVTCPGVDYTSAPTVTLHGGGGSGAAGTASLAASTSGGLTKFGSGTLTLSGANTYAGSTVVSNGVLALSGSGSIASANISVATNAIFNVSGVTGGSYALNGSGTLTLNIAKSGTTLTNGHVAAGTITAGGALNVTVSGDALADGDTFSLFNVQPSGTFATTNLPAIPSGGTNWWTADNYRTLTYNVWPTATGAGVTHPKGVSVKIPVASLVSGATNGKALLVTGTPTVSGAGFQQIGSVMLYTPGASDANDSFTYTVSDGRGGVASGTLDVQIDPASVIGQTSPRLEVQGGQISVKFYGVPGCTYVVERSLDLGSWTPISTNSVTTGSLEISIVDNPGAGSAYYRLKWQN